MGRALWPWPARIATVAVMFALLAVLGHFPMGQEPERGLLRLAWRMAGAQLRLCQERSQEELLRLPPHMRQRERCDEIAVPYRLTLRIDGVERIQRLVAPRGAKGDRPIYVAEDLELAPGPYRIEVRFEPELGGLDASGGDDERGGADEHERAGGSALREAMAKAPRYRLEADLVSRPGRIALVDLDEGAKELKLLGQ